MTVNFNGRSVPRPGAERSGQPLVGSPEELAEQLGYDPETFEVTNFWKKTSEVSIHMRPTKVPGVEPLSAERIAEILSHYPVPHQDPARYSEVFYATISDAQLGKPDGGGTAKTVERVKNALREAVARLVNDTAGVNTIVLANIGDFVEGAVSQNGKLPNDVGVAKQIEIATALLFEAVVAFAPYCSRLVVGTVPSNHGETRRDRNTDALDNFDITIAKGAELAISGRPGYEHVEFAYPEDDEVYLVIYHINGALGLAHGHVGTNTPESFRDRYVRNARASDSHPLSRCTVIGSGHFHHARWEDTGYGWEWVQAPALESGSSWFRQIFSKDSKKGILTGYLTDDGFELGQIHQGRGLSVN